MGIFDIFKNNKVIKSSENGILGPTFLEMYSEHIQNPDKLETHEWRRKLKSSSGNTFFKIKYYGELDSNLIVNTDFAPMIIWAIDISTGQEILLFDGCKHGYNALFCDVYTGEQINKREKFTIYKDKHGNELFEIVISTYYGIDFDDEFSDEVDENGYIKLIDNTLQEFEYVKRNGFDTLQIWATNEKGNTFEIVSEELA